MISYKRNGEEVIMMYILMTAW